ncbi:hypothetical protein GCM10010357_38260 [Streptomyces luteireticuli]|uniref:Uncharacterized protein n=1 Tax=Streptomyces luteireticuli TaxID=173858 RepID=A0ABP3IP94_9ACTN
MVGVGGTHRQCHFRFAQGRLRSIGLMPENGTLILADQSEVNTSGFTVEEAFIVNSYESDILPGALADLSAEDQARPLPELAGILLSLVDRGWIDVHWYIDRYLGPKVPRDLLPALLAAPGTWEYPEDHDWNGALTLVLTEAGTETAHLTAEELVQRP